MTGDPIPPRPKGADDALQAGAHLRLVKADDIMAELAAAAGPEPDKRPPVPIAESLPGWPYDSAIVAPAGYEYRPEGIGRIAHPPLLGDDGEPIRKRGQVILDRSKPATWALVRKQPIAIVGRARDLATGEEVVTVAWLRDGAWRDRPIPRGDLRDTRRITRTLAPLGVDVTSDTAAGLVAWLASCEEANLRTLPPDLVSSQMGWQAGTTATYLWGREAIGAEAIHYRGADVGGEALADAYTAAGTMEGWQAAVAPCAEHPRVQLAVYQSLSAPLLAVLGTPSCALDLCGPTSRGKTSTLEVAASCWGQPDPRREPSVIRSWDTTPIGVERLCGALGSLPLLLDDTSRARPGDVSTIVYTATQGVGRGRGSVTGMAAVPRWHLPMLSTGEQPLRSYGTAGGRTARCLTMWGAPWVGEAGDIVRAVVAGCREHYGHAGPALVRYTLEHRDCWPGLREHYRRARAEYVDLATGPVQERLAEYIAGLAVTIAQADLAGVLPWTVPTELLADLWPVLAAEVEDAHGAEESLAAIYTWALAHRDCYWSEVGAARPDGSPVSEYQPVGGWHGRWDRAPSWDRLSVVPQVLRAELTRMGYAADATLRAWDDRGWLDREPGHLTRQVKWGGGKSRLVCIRASAFAELAGPEEALP